MSIMGDELLQGEQVYLSSLGLDELKTLHPFASQPQYLRHASGRPAYPKTPEKQYENIKSARDKSQAYFFSIRLKDRTLIGSCAVQDIQWQMRYCTMQLGIPNPEHHGKGYEADATDILVRYAFMELNLNRVDADVPSYNTDELERFQQLGFKLEVTMREAVYRDLEFHNVHIVGLLRRDWENRA